MEAEASLGAWRTLRRRIGALFQSDINRRIFQAAFVVGGITFLVKITALFRDQVVASRFGAGDLVDAYLTAFFLPAFVVTALGDSIATPLTKGYIDIRENEGPEAAQELFSQVLTLGIIIFLVAWGLLWIFADTALKIVALNFDSEKFALTKHLYVIMLPMVLIGSLTGLLTTMLSGRERFSLSSWASIAPPVLSTLVLFFPGTNEKRIEWLSWALVAGAVLQLLILAWGLRREHI
ncbi:MAG: lipid II flippase MurJ, partial [Thermomicrobiales bacterium]